MIILFDLDGTVIDSTEPIVASFQHAFIQMSKSPPNRESILSLVGHPLDIMFENLQVPRDRVWDFVATYKQKYKEVSFAGTFLIDGALDAIEVASKFATLGVVTTKTSKYSNDLLEHLGILKYFKVLIGREDVINPKPDPEPIFKAIDKLAMHCDMKNIWMIGDTMMDIEAANRAGISHVAVFTGYAPRDVMQKNSLNSAENVYEAVKFIRNQYE